MAGKMKIKGTNSLDIFVKWLINLAEGQIESCSIIVTPNGNLHYVVNVIVG